MDEMRSKTEWTIGGKNNSGAPTPEQQVQQAPRPAQQPVQQAANQQAQSQVQLRSQAAAPKPYCNGVNINLVSQQMLDGMAGEEKITFVLDEVKLGKILVLEYGLTPEEQARLIERTMMEIDPETFIGIEMQSYSTEIKQGFLQKIMGKRVRPRMTVIGPADLLRIIHKDNKVIQTMILAGKSA